MININNCFPLTPAQQLHYRTYQLCPKKEILNIGTSLTLKENIDWDILQQTINQAYTNCEFMRVQFTQNQNDEIVQYIIEPSSKQFEFYDFSQEDIDIVEAKLCEWTQIPFKRFNSPLSKVIMISLPNGYKGIYLNVDHMIADAAGVFTFLKQLFEIYCSFQYNTKMPDPCMSYQKAVEKDIAYVNSKSYFKDLEYWKQAIESSEPIYTDIAGTNHLERERKKENNPSLRAAAVDIGEGKAKHIRYHLEEKSTKKLFDFCIQEKIPPATLFMMGLRTFLSWKNNHTNDISIKTAVARRGTLLEKLSGGTRVHFFPCRTIIEETLTFLEALQIVQENQSYLFRHANFDPGKIEEMRTNYYHHATGQGYESMSLTYQPLSLKDTNPEIRTIPVHIEWHSNGAAAFPAYLTIMHSTEDEGLDFVIEYQLGIVTQEQTKEVFETITKTLLTGVSNPTITIKELLSSI